MAHPNKDVRVVCAVIADESGRYLVARRPQGRALAGKWEFPGGKIEGAEIPQEALRREIREEMAAEIEVVNQLAEVIHHYQSGSIRLLPFCARLKTGTMRALEHDELRCVASGTLVPRSGGGRCADRSPASTGELRGDMNDALLVGQS